MQTRWAGTVREVPAFLVFRPADPMSRPAFSERLEPRRLLSGATGYAADPAFGGGDGTATFRVPGYDGSQNAERLAVDADGRVYVAGTAFGNGGSVGFVARLTDDGALDPTFGGGDGIALVNAGPDTALLDLEVAPDGDLIAVGYDRFVNGQAMLVRLTPDGDPDPAFVNGDQAFGGPGRFSAVGLDGDGLIYGGGGVRFFGNFTDLTASRFQADGRFDGTAAVDVFGGNDDVYDLFVDFDGTLTGVGRAFQSGVGQHPAVVRFTPGGNPDPGFGLDGDNTFRDVLGDGAFDRVDPLGNGAFLASGLIDDFATVARFTADGFLDPAFGSGGFARPNAALGFTNTDKVAKSVDGGALLLDARDDGAFRHPVLTRLDAGGAIDADFGTAGRVDVPVDVQSGFGVTPVDFVETAGGDLLVLGYAPGEGVVVTRLEPAGGGGGGGGGSAVLGPTGTLTITGTEAADDVLIENDFASDRIVVTFGDGTSAAFPFRDVGSIEAYLLGGDDALSVGQAVLVQVFYFGGEGEDALSVRGSAGNDGDGFVGASSVATFVSGGGNAVTGYDVEGVLADFGFGFDIVTIDLPADHAGDVTVLGGEGDDVVQIRSAPVDREAVRVEGGGGSDRLVFFDQASAGAFFDGGDGFDRIGVRGGMNGSADAAQVRWDQRPQVDGVVVVNTRATGSLPALTRGASFAGVEVLDLDLDNGDDSLRLAGVPAGVLLYADLGAGNDRLSIDAVGVWPYAGSEVDVRFGPGDGDALDFARFSPTPLTYEFAGGFASIPQFDLAVRVDAGLESVEFRGGSGDDAFRVEPDDATAVSVSGNANTTADPGDLLEILGPSAAGAVAGNGTVRFGDGSRPVSYDGIETFEGVMVDTTPPFVSNIAFEFEARQAVVVEFSEDVIDSLPPDGAVEVIDLATGQPVPASAVVTNTSGGAGVATRVEVVFPAGLPDGNYRATVAAGRYADAAGNAGDTTASLDFFVLAGDFNRDRSVNLSDFTVLANNFGQSGRTFSQGDANYDGVVNLSDFTILANRFGTTLPSPDDDGGSLFG